MSSIIVLPDKIFLCRGWFISLRLLTLRYLQQEHLYYLQCKLVNSISIDLLCKDLQWGLHWNLWPYWLWLYWEGSFFQFYIDPQQWLWRWGYWFLLLDFLLIGWVNSLLYKVKLLPKWFLTMKGMAFGF
jgi:hypothetical protein